MNSDQFTYWLQGFVELHGGVPTEEQWESIKAHLQTVFVKTTPVMTIPQLSKWECSSMWPETKIC